VAVFLYDRRGSGQSSAKPAGGDFRLLAEDGLAAARMLAQDPRIDRRRIGFWGLSQGGWLSLLAAAHGTRRWICNCRFGTDHDRRRADEFRGREHSKDQGPIRRPISTLPSLRERPWTISSGVASTARRHNNGWDRAAAKPWFDLIYMERTFADPEQSGLGQGTSANDPLPTLLEGKAPTLLIYGAADPWVPVRQSLAVLAARSPALTHVQDDRDRGRRSFHDAIDSAASQIDPEQFLRFAPTAQPISQCSVVAHSAGNRQDGGGRRRVGHAQYDRQHVARRAPRR
jgi:pimeloyl-ACP methyl ester carboxylesterase